MRCLWLTWTDPQPEHDGQRIYSGRLIDAVAAAGATIDVLCFASGKSPRQYGTTEGRVRWWPAPRALPPRWKSLFSPLPNIAYRFGVPTMRRALRDWASRKRWDAVVLDGLYAGWALPFLSNLRGPDGRSPRIVYVSHNHEETLRAGIARDYTGNPAMKAALHLDAAKTRRLERGMVDRADLITAITDQDARRYHSLRPDKRLIVLSPGYAGDRVPYRLITSDHPRRAIIVGSFEWIAKRMNLERFLSVADPLFAAKGAELHVVGSGDPAFLDRLRNRFQATHLLGSVPEIRSHLAEARIAIVPELTGGGFKLKVLDYVFNRLPVASLDGAVAGVPLQAPDSLLSFPTLESLACGVISAIDDLPLLNALHDRAYAACTTSFEWHKRGESLLAHTAAA